jgi:phage baseplate assembly protein V
MTGVVVERSAETMKVRVQFSERDGLVSDWLPVLQQKTLGDFAVWLPDLGSHVACLMDDHFEDGVVLGCIYSDADLPPVSDPDVFHREFSDGTVVQYNRKSHVLHANVKGDIVVEGSGDCNATIQGKTVLKSMGGVDIDGGPGNPKGAVQGDCICPFIKTKHLMVSDTVKESL